MAKQATTRDDKPGTRLLKRLRAAMLTPDLTAEVTDWTADPERVRIADVAQGAIDCLAAGDGEGAVVHAFAVFEGMMLMQAKSLSDLHKQTTYSHFQWLKKKCVDAMQGGKPIRDVGDNPKGTRIDPAVKQKAVDECKRLIKGGMKKATARLKMKNKYGIAPKTLQRAGA